MPQQLQFIVADSLKLPLYETDLESYLLTKKLLSPKSQQIYRLVLVQFCQMADWPPDEIDLVNFAADCQERGLAINTVSGYFDISKNFLVWLSDTGRIPPVDLDSVSGPVKGVKLPRAPRRESLRKLFDHLNGLVTGVVMSGNLVAGWMPIRDLAIFSTLYDTGLRIEELESLDIDDIDTDESVLFVTKGKRSKEREVPFAKKRQR